MKSLCALLCVAGVGLTAGCYSIEQSNVERGYRWIRRGQTDKAISTFSHTVSKYPDSLLGYAGLGDALFEARKNRDAIDAYSRAIAILEVAKPKSVKRDTAEIIGNRPLSYQNQGLRFPFGLEAYLYLRRGMVYHALVESAAGSDQRFFRLATADYDRALTLAPGYTAAKEAQDHLQKIAKPPNQALQPTAPSRRG